MVVTSGSAYPQTGSDSVLWNTGEKNANPWTLTEPMVEVKAIESAIALLVFTASLYSADTNGGREPETYFDRR